MEISRVQIEGGFLDGLDLAFSSGLNVVIGARGTGKTSVIELIRYALGSKNHTSEAKNRSLDHARAVLGGGEITVHLADLVSECTISRSADDDAPRSSNMFVPPIVLSQTEIETIGLSEAGRLSLLDGFISDRATLKAEEAAAVNSIRATYKEISAIESELSSMAESPGKTEALTKQLDDSQRELASLQGNSEEIAKKQQAANVLGDAISKLAVREESLTHFEENVDGWISSLDDLRLGNFDLDEWDGPVDEDPLSTLRKPYALALEYVSKAQATFYAIKKQATDARTGLISARVNVEKDARLLRVELDKITEGTGAISRQITTIRAQLAQLQARNQIAAERRNRLLLLRKRRDEQLQKLTDIRESRFRKRVTAAEKITQSLKPHIRIEVEQSAQYGEYARALTSALRGSGMKYNDLSSRISENISPRELISLVENEDFLQLADLAGIPPERSARLIGHLKEFGLSDIVTCEIQDNICMSLLDGVDYKDISALSAGQRCTVILSIVLQHVERTLIIDQPEDHLDNAFIASTVIKALRNSKDLGQVILTTHNANIPVLGNADLIVELTSDGRNGFVQVCKPLGHPDAVSAITNVMEGGYDAFRQRAAFYDEKTAL